MSALEQLLDTFVAAAESGDDKFRNANLSLHGDAAVSSVLDWAARRELAAVTRRRSDSRTEWTCTEIQFGAGAFVHVFSDSTPIQPSSHTERQSIPVIPAGGAL